MFELHPQLEMDTHPVLENERCLILIFKNSVLPWFIIVPKGDHKDFYHMNEDDQNYFNKLKGDLASFIREYFSVPKINTGIIGNVVPQLHIHIIGRSPEDPVWPDPVWGKLRAERPYDEESLGGIKESLLSHPGFQQLQSV